MWEQMWYDRPVMMRCANPNAHHWRWSREVVARGAASERPRDGYCPWCYQPTTIRVSVARSPLAAAPTLRGRARGRARVIQRVRRLNPTLLLTRRNLERDDGSELAIHAMKMQKRYEELLP